jgi:hypothetical protein
MIKFLVVDRYESAIDWGRRKAAHRLAMNRYATRESDDVRVVVRPAEVFNTGGMINLIRGPGFEEALTNPGEGGRIARENAEAFEALVTSGGARWVE